jgi:hypothetical protein
VRQATSSSKEERVEQRCRLLLSATPVCTVSSRFTRYIALECAHSPRVHIGSADRVRSWRVCLEWHT